MAKKNRRTASEEKRVKNQQAQAAAEETRRAEARAKSRNLSSAYLFVLFGVIGLVCMALTVKTLFFPAKSLTELGSNYLLLSLFALPYLVILAAVLVRRLLKKRIEGFSAGRQRFSKLLFWLIVLSAAILFGVQLRTGSSGADQHPVYTSCMEALESSGLEVKTADNTVKRFRTVLEQTSLTVDTICCGDSVVVLHYHEAGMGIPGRFLREADREYAGSGTASETVDGTAVTRWDIRGIDALSTAALGLRQGNRVLIYELRGPKQELEQLLPLLRQAGLRALQ